MEALLKNSLLLETVFLLLSFANVSIAQEAQSLVAIEEDVERVYLQVVGDDRVRTAVQQIFQREPLAPPFQEARRAAYYLQQMQARGLDDAYIDDEGNVIGLRKGSGNGPTLLIAAHLDTVFPEGVDTRVKLINNRYYAPGIGDDTRGLTALLSVIEVLNESGIETVGDIMFAGNVGEEGRGDLRGIKAIFRDHPEIDGFVSIDGVTLRRITTGGTGSRRFEFHFTGPGGHSFGAFGLASAIHAMGRAITKIAEFETPQFPKTTFTVGTVTGGTSVNSIAANASFALDMRSNDIEELKQLEARAKAAAFEAVAEENARWNDGEITVEFNLIGDRPVGMTPTSSPLVQVAALAFATIGIELRELGISSTDSNVPMSLGIPAITIAGGGQGGGSHSPDEWFSPTNSHRGPQIALLLTLGMVGIEGLSAALLAERTP